MNNLRRISKNFLLGILLLMSVSFFAQEDRLSRARTLLDTHIPANVDLARSAIDSAITHPQTKDDYITWTVRAFIYFDIYKRQDKLKLNSALRDTLVSSVYTSNKLHPDETYAENNKKLLDNIGKGYFNLAKSLLQDSINSEKSFIAYNRFKDIFKYLDPTTNFTNRDIEYNLAVGSIFSEIFIKDNNNVNAQNIGKVALMKVLEVQPENPSANINMGLMYYNQAVNLSKSMDYGVDFTQIDIIQDNMIKLAKQSEQFIIKVYNADNNNVSATEALFYIYRMLLDIPKSEEFKKKAIAKGVKFPEEKANEEKK